MGVGSEGRGWASNPVPGMVTPRWTRLVINGGSFAANGEERRPSKEVKADVDSVSRVIRHANRDSTKVPPR